MAVRPITETLALLNGGLFIDQCSEKLAEAVRAVDETGKDGKVTITLTLKRSAGAIEIVPAVTNKAPEPKPDSTLLWPTVEGNLTPQNPNQRNLDLRVVDQAKVAPKTVDPEGGEVRVAGA